MGATFNIERGSESNTYSVKGSSIAHKLGNDLAAYGRMDLFAQEPKWKGKHSPDAIPAVKDIMTLDKRSAQMLYRELDALSKRSPADRELSAFLSKLTRAGVRE